MLNAHTHRHTAPRRIGPICSGPMLAHLRNGYCSPNLIYAQFGNKYLTGKYPKQLLQQSTLEC